MPRTDIWTRVPNLGTKIWTYLQQQYPIYRASITGLTQAQLDELFPPIDQVEFGTWVSGSTGHTIHANEEFIETDLDSMSVGWTHKKDLAPITTYFFTRWFAAGDPPWLFEIRHFFDETLSSLAWKIPIDSALKAQMHPIKSLRVLRMQILQGKESQRALGSQVLESIGTNDTDFWTVLVVCQALLYQQKLG